ncbi:MAG: hypothetical protein MNPFHGCM_01919 [Gemmatimonadaceae bacterium]|nr:hypothetical protein [Gemmatimonadaceae bacterium]
MATKREERLQRSEARKKDEIRRQRQQVWRKRVLVIAGALGILTLGFVLKRQREATSDGRVWSAAHGHWHDRYGMEIR